MWPDACLLYVTGSKLSKPVPSHPLDPLSAKEIVESAAICRTYAKEQKLGELRFNTITLRVSYITTRRALSANCGSGSCR